MIPAPAVVAEMIRVAVIAADQDRPRAQQKADGMLGFSSIGFCRQAALLTLRETPPSDPYDSWAAIEGTALGEVIESALARRHPTWIFPNLNDQRIVATLSSGDTIGGTPDAVIPQWNALIDLKSKDGLGEARRKPWTDNYRFQLWLQALAAVQAGWLDPTKPITLCLAYVDRAGSEDPWLIVPEYLVWDPLVENEIIDWISDVKYAATHGEDASQDIPAPVCERICEFFTVCRGSLPVTDSEGPLTDEWLIEGVAWYIEAKQQEKEAASTKKAARLRLLGHNGTALGHRVRTTDVAPSQIPGNERVGYSKLEVRPVRRRA